VGVDVRVHASGVLLQVGHHVAALPATKDELLPGCQQLLKHQTTFYYTNHAVKSWRGTRLF
jgi:hypothetical protein